MDLSKIDWQGLLKNPAVLGGVGGLVLLVIIIAVAKKGGGRRKTKVVDDTKSRARGRIKNDFNMFRNDVNKAKSLAAPVFRKIDSESAQAQAIGHWRKTMNHRIAIRSPDLNALKGVARSLGHDARHLWQSRDRGGRGAGCVRHRDRDGDRQPADPERGFEREQLSRRLVGQSRGRLRRLRQDQ